jgi:hemerythrin-like domain-containing protein
MKTPNVGVGLIRFHRIITRGLEVILDHAPDYSLTGFPDAVTRQGFIHYARSWITALTGHHIGEDEIGFPAQRKVLPHGPYERLTAEHQAMVPLLDRAGKLLDRMEKGEDEKALLVELHGIVSEIGRIWYPHIETEESHFSAEIVAGLFTVEEHIGLIKKLAEHGQALAKPDYLLAPFFVYNLTSPDREEFMALLPPVVTQQLIPIVWKDQWAPMKPFLLE